MILVGDGPEQPVSLAPAVLAAGLLPVPQVDHGRSGDVVVEWAGRHGQPFRLTLTGPAGGRWTSGTGGEELELDAVEFCRITSGRGTGEGLLGVAVPF